jgi:hypothetical protein
MLLEDLDAGSTLVTSCGSNDFAIGADTFRHNGVFQYKAPGLGDDSVAGVQVAIATWAVVLKT